MNQTTKILPKIKSKLNWIIIIIAALIAAIYVLIKIDIQTSFNFEDVAKLSLTILIEILFYGVFFRIYESQFFKEHWNWRHFIYVFIPFGLTSSFYFFQDNVYFTYTTWILWILAIVWGHFTLFYSEDKEKKQPWNMFIVLVLAIWITGFAFPELGSIKFLNFHFASNIYLQIPFIRWIIDLRTLFTILFLGVILIKPFFSMEWKLEKLGTDNSVPEIPNELNTFIILIKAIQNGIKRANNYLNKIILNLKVLAKRYGTNFLISLKQISLRTYSTLLMTISLISVFVLSRIAQILANELFYLIKSASLSADLGHLKMVIVNTLFIYLLLLLNWLFFNENIFFTLTNVKNLNKAIWYVFYEYSQILLIKIPGFLFLISAVAWIFVFFYDLFANRPFIFPGIYILICLFVFLIYVIYNRITQPKIERK